MTELIGINPADCGQLNGAKSCEGCPVYAVAKEIVVDSRQDAVQTLGTTKIASQCPEGAKMDLAVLGIKVKPEIGTRGLQEVVSNPRRPRRVRVW